VTIDRPVSSQTQGVTTARTTPPAEPTIRPAARSAVQAQHDAVSFSTRAREVQRAVEAAHAVPDIRRDLVEDLRRRIAAGTYYVPAEVLADLLLGK
jgi:negative regulator of flagellin synthesis FlgM